MKANFSNILMLGALLCSTTLFAQSNKLHPARDNETIGHESGLPNLSLQNNKVPASASVSADQILWQRDVYRMIDLNKDKNASLYSPIQAEGNKKNLFLLLFENVSNGTLAAYDYLDGREVFTNDYKVKFNEMLDRFWIPYEEVPNAKNPQKKQYKIDLADIPSAEVTLYYIKESYFLDQRNNAVRTKIMALCPVLIREDEMGEVRKYPMFWVPFEAAKELLSQQEISTNTYNSAGRMSICDFFVRRQYQGDIYKVSNPKNQNIMDYCKTPEEIKAEQIRLEKELKDITASLWTKNQREEAEKQQAYAQKKGKKATKEAQSLADNSSTSEQEAVSSNKEAAEQARPAGGNSLPKEDSSDKDNESE